MDDFFAARWRLIDRAGEVLALAILVLVLTVVW